MRSKVLNLFRVLLVAALAWSLGYSPARGQQGVPQQPSAPLGTAFNYQGSLKHGGSAVNATCQMAFRLFGSQLGTDLVGTPLTTTVPVTNGLFSQALDFGSGAFDGSQRWLEVMVECPGETAFTTLARQEINAVPYALSAPWSGISGKPSNVVVVAKSGGDFNTITAALDSISDASETNPYLVKIMPGVYTETVTMKEFVDLEGSGVQATKIMSVGSSEYYTATLVGASNAEARFLAVQNIGGADHAIGILNQDASPSFTKVGVIVSGGSNNVGISNHGGAPAFNDSFVYVVGGDYSAGMECYGSSPSIENMYINISDSITETYAIYLDNSSPAMKDVTGVASGMVTTWGVFVGNGSAPSMTDVTARASGGSAAYGIDIENSNPVMQDVIASAEDATDNLGIQISNSTSPSLKDVTASASGGTYTYGIDIYNSSPVLQNVTATALDGTTNRGIFVNAGSSAVFIERDRQSFRR